MNLNKIALLRNSRGGDYPDPGYFARLCIEAGCGGLTVHPRPDERHIRAADVRALGACAARGGVEFNIEGNPFAAAGGGYPGLLRLAEEVRPAQVTLVPDAAGQLTSDHGFDLRRDGGRLGAVIERLQGWGVRVSLFLEADLAEIRRAAAIGAARVELYTGPYAAAFAAWEGGDEAADFAGVCGRYAAAVREARGLGLGVNAGHDLNLRNLPALLRIGGILEVSIGHALVVDALEMGWGGAVGAYLGVVGGVSESF